MPTGSAQLASAILRKERALADRREIEVAKLRGELVPRAEVVAHWQTMLANLRARLLMLPDRTASLVLAAGSRAEVKTVLETVVREALDELQRSDGVPVARGRNGTGTAASADREPVGGPAPDAVARGKRGAGSVGHPKSRVSAGDNGRSQRPRGARGRGDDQRAGRQE